MKRIAFALSLVAGIVLIFSLVFAAGPRTVLSVPTTLLDFFFPGSQPLESGTFSNPGLCDNCHGGYGEQSVEPSFNWQGSMMSQAQRDPLYLACLTIANQDAPMVGDLCIRCHSPKGWLEGRSTPVDGSALTADDRHSVQCHFCHRLIQPTAPGVNPYPGDLLYTQSPGGGNPSTYALDQAYIATLTSIPPANANGMYVAENLDNRRGPYFNPQANHAVPYSPMHLTSQICGTCHDVSNPVYKSVYVNGDIDYVPNTFNAPADSFGTYSMFPIERTYSEWMKSQYNTPGGVTGTAFGGNKAFVSTCQDCHMKDVTGHGCNKTYAPLRTDLPLHDQTGGNTFIPDLINLVYPGEASQAALDSGKARARWMLRHAASLEAGVNPGAHTVNVKVTNETGHKLPSGYPEGRRIWIQVTASSALTGQTFVSGAYDTATGVLTTTGTRIYEIKPGISPALSAIVGVPAGESFHFVLNDTIYMDNRIPPRGFTNAGFKAIQSPPVGYAYNDGQYWDFSLYTLPFEPDYVQVNLCYQTTSKEYVEFLRDANVTNNAGQTMYDLWYAHGKSMPEVMNMLLWNRVTRWTGAVSASWNESGNWDNGIPSDSVTAVMAAAPASQPIVTGNASCRHLVIPKNARLTVGAGISLTVHGDLSIKADTVLLKNLFRGNRLIRVKD